MATFRNGDRVRRVQVVCVSVPVGTEGTFLGYIEGDLCAVAWDNGAHPDGWFSWTLEPLAPHDTKADEFIANLKKLKPYEEPKVEPQFTRIAGYTKFPTAQYGDMTLVCTKDGVFAYRDGAWTKIEPK